MANISFGERLKRARIRSAMTQAELGEKVGVSQALISQWEKGNSEPSKQQKEKLKKILGGWAAGKSTDEANGATEVSPGALSAWLNRTRNLKNLSPPELAEMAGLSVVSIYNIESGRISNPRDETIKKLERALKSTLSTETKEEIREEAEIEGLGEFIEFDPHNDNDLPSAPGIYMLYDISERPIYVGQGADIRNRIKSHQEK
jgi:transcriptional regulator with XRE-family HTH domain